MDAALTPAQQILSAANIAAPNPTQDFALRLYDLGFNVFPQPYGHKGGYPWKGLQRVRLPREDVGRFFGEYRVNIAVMMGETSGNLFVLDCETMGVYEHYSDALRYRGIPVVSVKTARGAHILLRCADGAVKNIPRYDPQRHGDKCAGKLFDAELRGTDCYVLTAGSLHPSGVFYTGLENWPNEPPTVTRRQIDFLMDADGQPVQLQIKRPGRRSNIAPRNSRLSKATVDYLRTGSTYHEGVRNDALFAAACDYAGCGYSYDRAVIDLAPLAESSGLEARAVTATIRSAYSKDRQAARKADLLTWELAAAYAARRAGWVKPSDRRVFDALIVRAREGMGKSGTFRASVRELATIARASHHTISAALNRLASTDVYDPPLIKHAGVDKDSQAALWRFTDGVIEAGKNTTRDKSATLEATLLTNGKGSGVAVLSCHHDTVTSSSGSLLSRHDTDALERGALGYTGMLVLQTLIDFARPATVNEIASAANLTRRQVHYALRTPEKGGLLRLSGAVEQRDGNLWAADPVAAADAWLDEHVTVRASAGEHRQAMFDQERAIYAATQVQRAIAHALKAQKRKENVQHVQTVEPVRQPLIEAACKLGGKIVRIKNANQSHNQPYRPGQDATRQRSAALHSVSVPSRSPEYQRRPLPRGHGTVP